MKKTVRVNVEDSNMTLFDDIYRADVMDEELLPSDPYIESDGEFLVAEDHHSTYKAKATFYSTRFFF